VNSSIFHAKMVLSYLKDYVKSTTHLVILFIMNFIIITLILLINQGSALRYSGKLWFL
jgi:hypothetical protein